MFYNDPRIDTLKLIVNCVICVYWGLGVMKGLIHDKIVN